MSVTTAQGFLAAGVAAGLKSTSAKDVALVVNIGPQARAAAVFTTNRFAAAPVIWSRQILLGNDGRIVVLNSGGANACTGPQGFLDTHATAEFVSAELTSTGTIEVGAGEVFVCSTGLIGEPLNMQLKFSSLDFL